MYQNVELLNLFFVHFPSYEFELLLKRWGRLYDSCAVLDVVDYTAKDTFQISGTVVPINYDWLQVLLYDVLIPILVQELTLAAHAEYHQVEATVLVKLHLYVELLS